MRILVTGGLGFIGHNVVSMLEQLGHNVTVVDSKTTYGIIPAKELNYLMVLRNKKIKAAIHTMNIASAEQIDWLFHQNNFDMVIHTASCPRQKIVNVNPQLGSVTLSEGLLNLLEASKNHLIKKFVYISSSMVYGDFNNVKEDAICNPQGTYGILKLAGEWLTKDYAKNNFVYTIVRPSAVYGPLDVMDRVVSKFLLGAIQGQAITVHGPDETLDFTYVDDIATGIVQAALSDCANNETYNITRGQSRTLLEAAQIAIMIAGKGTIDAKNRDMSFPKRGTLDIDAARADFEYSPKIDIEEGFRIYYEFLKNTTFWHSKTV